MASIVKLGKGKNPPRAIDFKNTTGKRDRVRLGIVTHDDAEECCRRVEKLLTAKRFNQSPDTPTAEWLAGVSDDIHARLARFGLCEPRVPVNAAPMLGEWLTKYIDQRRSELKPGSIERLERTAERLKTYFRADTPIDELTPAGAADWRAAMLAEKKPHKRGEDSQPRLTETTVRNYSRDAKTIFNAAVDRELIDRNPFRKLKSSVLAANRDRYVTADEAAKILDACHSSAWRVLFGLARFAGLRSTSETHRLTWADVDWARKRLSVYAPKTDSTRIVPITADLFDILQETFDAAAEGTINVVCLGSHRSNLHRGLETIIKRAGLAPWDDLFQTLRRSAETDFARTHPQHAVSKWIGHSMAVSERHYLQVTDDLIDAATGPNSRIVPVEHQQRSDLATTSDDELRAAESAAVGSRTSSQVQETRRNDGSLGMPACVVKECEKPLKTGAFRDSKGGTRTRDPRLMKPVL